VIGLHYVAQVGFKLLILRPQSPECWVSEMCTTTPSHYFYFYRHRNKLSEFKCPNISECELELETKYAQVNFSL
jgi:hypothetical protein